MSTVNTTTIIYSVEVKDPTCRSHWSPTEP
jgi:hypothetical protein